MALKLSLTGPAQRLAALGLALSAPAYAQEAAPAAQDGPVCVYPEIAFSGAFPGGRLNGCERTGANAFVLEIEPEDADINPSPWYGFDITSDTARALTLTLDYGDYEHRYSPKIQDAAGEWRALGSDVALGDEDTEARFTLDVPAGRVRIAGQQVITLEDDRAWAEALADDTALEMQTLGRSAEGREIIALASGGDQNETLVITGRQHPPELTGAYALRDFVGRLMENDALAERFRGRYGLLIAPMLNPDGVAHGNWRHDTAGTDLNRDWGPFARPETQRVLDRLTALNEAGKPPALVLDFHSTWRDVLYTQPDDAPGARADFQGRWHAAINARRQAEDIERSAGYNSGKPTLKSWAHEAYGVPAITYEMGDATPRETIRATARIAAEEMMRLLLAEAPTSVSDHPRK